MYARVITTHDETDVKGQFSHQSADIRHHFEQFFTRQTVACDRRSVRHA